MRDHRKFLPVVGFIVLLLAACGQSVTPTPSSVAPDGATSYRTQGCATCHGDAAQGGTGPSILHHTVAQVTKQVRTPSGVMPAFDVASLSDAELASIASYIAELEAVDSHDEPDHASEHSH